jgi:hypothetical protein
MLKNDSSNNTRRSRVQAVQTILHETHGFSSLAFSHDDHFLVAQGTTSKYVFVLWEWAKAQKVVTTEVHAAVSRICFNPIDATHISTSGGFHLRLWKVKEPTCRQFADFTAASATVKYVDHTWVPKSDRIIALLENGDIQYICKHVLVRTIPCLHHGNLLLCVQSVENR